MGKFRTKANNIRRIIPKKSLMLLQNLSTIIQCRHLQIPTGVLLLDKSICTTHIYNHNPKYSCMKQAG